MGTLQIVEEKRREINEYLEGGKVPRKRYSRCILDQFTLWNDIPYFSITKKDGSLHFCLVVSQTLKKGAVHHAHVKS